MNSSAPASEVVKNQKQIGIWLICVAILVFLIIMVGGATRLTNSGLSIAHWSPINGAIPPLDAQDWAREFAQYQQIPEYKLENHGMSMDEFKFIFWWEWAHRLLGRIIGLAVLLPFLYFLLSRKLNSKDLLPLFCIVLLVGLQGLIGWWMVSSGLKGDRVDVAAYRLAGHLGMGFLLLGLLANMGYRRVCGITTAQSGKGLWTTILVLVFAQVIFGAFTAGTHAGFVHSDWPKIDGNWLPQSYFTLSPLWHNFTQNTQTIQFNHRIMAYLIVFLIFIVRIKAGLRAASRHHLFATLCLIVCILQVVLGISLLRIFTEHTPPQTIGVLYGVAHQALAAIFFVLVTLTWQTAPNKFTNKRY